MIDKALCIGCPREKICDAVEECPLKKKDITKLTDAEFRHYKLITRDERKDEIEKQAAARRDIDAGILSPDALPEGAREKRKPGRPPKAEAISSIPESERDSLLRHCKGEEAYGLHGDFKSGWRYKEADGSWLFAVARYHPPKGDDELVAYYFGADGKWHEGKPRDKRLPLYRLPEMLAAKDRAVLIVGDEICAETANKKLGGAYEAVTWFGGAAAVKCFDWSPLENRDVTIWPDFCEAGLKAAMEIRKKLPRAQILDIRNE